MRGPEQEVEIAPPLSARGEGSLRLQDDGVAAATREGIAAGHVQPQAVARQQAEGDRVERDAVALHRARGQRLRRVEAMPVAGAHEAITQAWRTGDEAKAFDSFQRQVTEGVDVWYDMIDAFYRLQNLFTAFAVRKRFREPVVRILAHGPPYHRRVRCLALAFTIIQFGSFP